MNVFIIGSENPLKDPFVKNRFRAASRTLTYMEHHPINPVEMWPKYARHNRIDQTDIAQQVQWERETIRKSDAVYVLDTTKRDMKAQALKNYADSIKKTVVVLKFSSRK